MHRIRLARAGRGLLAGIILIVLVSPSPGMTRRSLSFEQRVQAQEAIERLYHQHQVGATAPFDQTVPRNLLEERVRTYLKQSAALETIWNAPITAASLRAELDRIESHTRLPGRLRELHQALDHDPFLIQECLVRASLAGRLVRERFASDESLHADPGLTWDAWWADVEPGLNAAQVEAVAEEGEIEEFPADGCAAEESWSLLPVNSSLVPRYLSTAVWTGSLMIVWGGVDTVGPTSTGGRYDPLLDTWTPTSPAGSPTARSRHTAVWTGREMIIWGGNASTGPLATGGRYNPLTDTWSPTATTGAPLARVAHTAIWTGDVMVVWGGSLSVGDTNTGGRYDPVRDVWTPTSTRPTTPVPSPRTAHTAVWTGREMIVWGGSAAGVKLSTGGYYDPGADHWSRPTSTGPGLPMARSGHVAVWTGGSMIVWGGSSDGPSLNTGGQLRDGIWSPTTMVDAPFERTATTAIWTGASMVIWGGEPAPPPEFARTNTGGRYDPLTDSWSQTSLIAVPGPRAYHTAVWTGSAMLVHGGSEAGGSYFFGGLPDADADGFRGCDGDCDDINPAVHPGAEEVCGNGVDEDCDGLADVLPGAGAACDTLQPGICAVGITACSEGTLHCQPHVAPTPEICNGLDDDCNGILASFEMDADHDGASPCQGDCVDTDASVHPHAMEVCDGKDNNCDGIEMLGGEADIDGDGSRTCSMQYCIDPYQRWCTGDCDDGNPHVHPNAPEICGDGIINSCITRLWRLHGEYCTAGLWSEVDDCDGDGFTGCQGDCNDHHALVGPGAPEACDGIDNDCNGIVDDLGDGGIDIPGDPVDQDCLNGPACDPGGAWQNHGAYVSCVENACEQLKQARLLTGKACEAIVEAVATNQWGGP